MAWDKEVDGLAMDTAAAKAKAELDELIRRMAPAERKGADVIMSWWKANYMTAGHKRLGRALIELSRRGG